MNNDLREALFNYIYKLLFAYGGDGTVGVIGYNWRNTASFFENWVKLNHPGTLERMDSENYIVFHYEQADLFFSDKEQDGFGLYDIIKVSFA